MYRTKSSKFVYLFLLALLLYGFSGIFTYSSYDYNIGVSRKYYSGNNDYIVGSGGQTYAQEYFTGVWYCTGYYYLNHQKITKVDPFSLTRQVLWYNASDITMFLGYLNFKTWWVDDQWETLGQEWYTGRDGKDIFMFPLIKKGGGSTDIPYTFTIGRFSIINTQPINSTTISGYYYISDPTIPQSTYFAHANGDFIHKADTGYHTDIVYYAQPCIPDTPITSSYTTKINGNANNLYTLARVPAFNFENNWYTNTKSWRPLTLGYTNFATSNFIPGSRNVSAFNKVISFDSGIYLAWIKEPDISSYPDQSFVQAYYYNSWSARYSWFALLDADFVPSGSGTSNQRWINPDTIKVYLSFTGVDKTDYADAGTPCTITIAWDTDLWLVWLWYSWNRNQLWYSVNISSGTIRTLAKQQCSFGGVDTWNIELKRETLATIKWDAWDLANSMIISQDYNTETYAPANQITEATGYNFNSYTSLPVLSMATDTTWLVNATTGYNVPITNQNLFFTGTDDYAGINSGTFLIIVTGQESTIQKSNTWQWWAIRSYVYSWTDITKFPYLNAIIDRDNYTWLVDFITKLSPVTGMHFTVYFEVRDFVGNTKTQNYIFRTPTRPNAPKWDPVNLLGKTKTPITPITILNNVLDSDIVDGWWSQYNYWTYYPSHRALVADLWYISGALVFTSTQDLVLTAENGNVWWATIVTMTGLQFVYDGSGSYLTGTPYVSSGGVAMDDYLATDFTFQILATNIYGITWVITYTINVAPSCTESAWCTDPVYVFRGTTLSGAMAQQTAALASGEAYLKANHRYPHRFAEIKQTGPDFFFTGDALTQTLYCVSSGNDLLINYWGYSGPQSTLETFPLSADYTWTNLTVSGGDIYQFGVFTASVSADYVTDPSNWDMMTIYINRPLTGKVFYSVCEFTGWTLDAFGCPVVAGHNRTWDINRTRLTIADTFTMTGWIEWWRLTWNRNGYVTGWSLNTGDQFDFRSTGIAYDWWWYRQYLRTLSGDIQENINTSWNVSFDIESRTGNTATFDYEIYRIDNTAPQVTWSVAGVPGESVTLTLNGSNTGQLSNSYVSDLIGDDEYIITSFSGDTIPQLYESGFGSSIYTGGRYINGSGSEYSMTHTMMFAANRTGDICMQDRAGNESCIYVEALWITNVVNLEITVRPAFRPDPASNITWYSIQSWDFRFFIQSGSDWIQIYNSAINIWTNPKISTNEYGTGMVFITTPVNGSVYLVVFKWPGTLSAGFTGTRSSSITGMNFFTWTFADNLSSDFAYKFYNTGTSTMEHYLKVGDTISDTSGDFDYVGTTDFSQINNNLTLWMNTMPFYRYDFDLNNVISSMEQSMVLEARDSHGFIWRLDNNNIAPMTGFVAF